MTENKIQNQPASTSDTPINPETTPRHTTRIVLLLAASVALMMTGFGIIMPVFARRLGELGAGVEALGLMTVAFALAQFVAAPFLGSLADRFGRRPLVLFSLASFSLVNIGYLLTTSSMGFIIMRGLAGALTAGLFPAAMGVVSDIVPKKESARWVGVIMSGYGIGFIFGPVFGGLLYDGWGFAAPFIASAVMGSIALIVAGIMVPETRPPTLPESHPQAKTESTGQKASIWTFVPRPIYIFATLLFVEFTGSFAFAFIEPQMVFYLYDELGWSTAQFGLVVGIYGLAMVLGQMFLGQTSDHFGRKPIIVLGILLNSTLFIGLAVVTSFGWITIITAIAGLGAGLIAPAISAFYLDITAEPYRSRVIGIKESSLALGGVMGPLLVVVASRVTTAHGIFAIAAGAMLLGGLLAFIILKDMRNALPNPENPELADKLIQSHPAPAQ